MRQALAAQSGATRDPGVGGIASFDQMPTDAKRAHDFVRWVLGPPRAPQAQPIGDAALRAGLQPVAGVPRNVVATSAAAPPSVVAAPGADDANGPSPPPDQQPDVGVANGNPNIERQGARARTIAGTRPPRPPAIADIWPEIGGAAADAFHDINAGSNPFSAEARTGTEAGANDGSTRLDGFQTGAAPLSVYPSVSPPDGAVGKNAGPVADRVDAPPTLSNANTGALRGSPDVVYAQYRIRGARRGPAGRDLTFPEENRLFLYDTAIETLRRLDPKNPQLESIYGPGWVPSNEDIQTINREIETLRRGERDLGRERDLEKHHNLPQEFTDEFKACGLDPDDYITYMLKKEHRLRPDGLHTGPNSWNAQWREFFRQHDDPTPDEIHEQLNSMIKQRMKP
jgi:hypothetical protein